MLIKIEDFTLITESAFKLQYPNTSFPIVLTDAVLLDFGYAVLHESEQPAPPLGYNYVENGYERVDNKYQTKYTLVPETEEQLRERQKSVQADITDAAQQRMDAFARTRGYDGILSACTYATSAVPKFAQEGQYAVQARDATWVTLYQIMLDVENGSRPLPSSYKEVESLLPPLQWPS